MPPFWCEGAEPNTQLHVSPWKRLSPLVSQWSLVQQMLLFQFANFQMLRVCFRFEQRSYVVDSLQENSAVNAYVTTVRATDADVGDNGHVTYAVDQTKGNASALFDVEPESGRVIVKQVRMR